MVEGKEKYMQDVESCLWDVGLTAPRREENCREVGLTASRRKENCIREADNTSFKKEKSCLLEVE